MRETDDKVQRWLFIAVWAPVGDGFFFPLAPSDHIGKISHVKPKTINPENF